MKVPFLDLVSQQREVSAEVLAGWTDILERAAFIGGAPVSGFEADFAAYTGTAHCVGVANGTDAIEIALRAVGVGPGDEVIMPVNTFIATAEAVSRVGAVPVFVDVDPLHLLMDPAATEAAVTARTRALVPVHLYGQMAPLEHLLPIAERVGIPLIEDNAQAQGASSPAGRAGAVGTVAATSFYPGKNLGAAGDAGAITTGDAEIARVSREISSHGSTVKYVHERVGLNSRLDAVQAVVLRAKLARLEHWNTARRAAADRYRELLAGIEGVDAPVSREGNVDVWHLYVVQVARREAVMEALAAQGVGSAIHYPAPLHLTAAYRHLGYRVGQFPVAERAAGRILSLPMFPHLTADAQEHVAEALAGAVASP